ncbi:YibE/F family protein [Georgenia sp. Z1491]|uniref:YibE/F family protein n=1 Tax=Georgenia sp. Z1491 TaxID=3416707 RepID=UPI003CF0A29C
MSHSHSTVTSELPEGRRRRVRRLLAALVLPLLVATIVGLVALWPRGESPMGSLPLLQDGTQIVSAEVIEAPDPDDPASEMLARVTEGGHDGHETAVAPPHPSVAAHIDVGDRVQLLYVPSNIGTGTLYSFWEFERTVPVAWLTVLYLAAVLAVARWKGLAAVVGLLGSLAVVALFILPVLMLGSSPVLTALVGSSAMMFLAVYLAHGVSIRTTTALLGTFVGLAVTVLLAMWGTGAANLTGAAETGLMLFQQFPGISLGDLLMCGIVIAGLGALNDVTITQASAAWEIAAADPGVSRRRLFVRTMRIGRDHIASTVYTLAFAYVGTALPLIMLASLVERPVADTLLSGEIAEEVVRTLVSSIGLVLAIPVTTAIAALLASSGTGADDETDAEVSRPSSRYPARSCG